MNGNLENTTDRAELRGWNKFLRDMGVSPVTGWRWRNKGWIECLNIDGRLYVTKEEISRFKQRAKAGEFAKEHQVPERAAA